MTSCFGWVCGVEDAKVLETTFLRLTLEEALEVLVFEADDCFTVDVVEVESMRSHEEGWPFFSIGGLRFFVFTSFQPSSPWLTMIQVDLSNLRRD